jgi:RNase adaptor protein for sRNA GlmZ degradation
LPLTVPPPLLPPLHQIMEPMVDTTTMASTDLGIMVVIMMMDSIDRDFTVMMDSIEMDITPVTMPVGMLDLSLEFRYL